MFPLPETHYT